MDFFAPQADQPLFEINLQIQCLIHMTGSLGVAVPQRSTDSGHKLTGAEGFRDIIVRTQIQSGDFLLLLGAGGYNDHRNIAPGTEFLQYFQTIHVRQPQIQQDHVGTERGTEA